MSVTALATAATIAATPINVDEMRTEYPILKQIDLTQESDPARKGTAIIQITAGKHGELFTVLNLPNSEEILTAHLGSRPKRVLVLHDNLESLGDITSVNIPGVDVILYNTHNQVSRTLENMQPAQSVDPKASHSSVGADFSDSAPSGAGSVNTSGGSDTSPNKGSESSNTSGEAQPASTDASDDQGGYLSEGGDGFQQAATSILDSDSPKGAVIATAENDWINSLSLADAKKLIEENSGKVTFSALIIVLIGLIALYINSTNSIQRQKIMEQITSKWRMLQSLKSASKNRGNDGFTQRIAGFDFSGITKRGDSGF